MLIQVGRALGGIVYGCLVVVKKDQKGWVVVGLVNGKSICIPHGS